MSKSELFTTFWLIGMAILGGLTAHWRIDDLRKRIEKIEKDK